MFVTLVHSEYQANLGKILPPRQGLVKTNLKKMMRSDCCKELPSSCPGLQEQALRHIAQDTSGSDFLQHAAS